MDTYTSWIKQHQVAAFYILVFGISWPAMIVAFFVFSHNAAAQAPFGLVATFSPVLIALMISAIVRPGPKRERTGTRWIVFIAAWLFAWVVLSLHTWQIRDVPLGPETVIPTGIVALLPGWLISCAYSRIPGVRQLFGTLLRPRRCVLWYLAAILIVPAIQMTGAGLTLLAGGEVASELSGMSISGGFVLIALTFLNGFLVSGGINEETGWRGFVLPRLQATFPVIGAVVIVWFFWALWHIPYDIGMGVPLEGILINRIVHNFIFALLMAWLYNRTGGSLLAPALFHPAMNAFGNILPRTDAGLALMIILVIAVIIGDRMWKRLPNDDPAVHPAMNHSTADE